MITNWFRTSKPERGLCDSIDDGSSMGIALPEFVTNRTNRVFVKKGWGYEDWIWNGEYCGKLLFFCAGKKCSFHYHLIKDEVLFLQSGRILMKYSDNDDLSNACEIELMPGMAFHVMPGIRHQMIAKEESLIFEVSTHHEDNDSIRVVRGD